MVTQAVIGVVRALNGILEKINAHGEAHIVKSGAPLHQGDILTLLSGEAYIQFIQGFPEALALNKPFPLDGISPALKFGALNANEELIQEAIAKGIDPSLVLDVLGATAAGVEVLGSGGDSFYLDPMYGAGLVSSGYNSLPLSFDNYRSLMDPQGVVFRPISETAAEPVISAQSDAVVIPDITIPPSVINGIFTGEVTESGGLNNSIPGSPKFSAQITSVDGFVPGDKIGSLGTFTMDSTGKWTYELHDNSPLVDALKAGEVQVVTFDAVATDGTIQKITVTIHGENDAPYALPENGVAREDTAITGNLLINDKDPEGDPISITTFTLEGNTVVYQAGQTVTIDGKGQLTILANGDYSFTPFPNYNGPIPITTYTLSDGTIENSTTFSLNVSSVNDAPEGTDSSITTAEDTPIVLNAADFGFTDPNDNPADSLLAVKISTLPLEGSLYLNGAAVTAGQLISAAAIHAGSLVFIPAANMNGTINFTFQVQDTGGTLNGGVDLDPIPNTLTINVTPVDDAFNDAAETLTVSEDSTLTGNVLTGTSSVDGPVTVTGFNVAGDTTNYSAGQTAAIAGVGSLQINGDGTFSFIPVANYNGPVPEITYTMTDGSSGDTSTLTINVTPVDDAFSDANEVLSVAEDTTLNGNVLTGTSSVDGPVTVTGFSVAGDNTNYSAGQTAAIAGVGSLQINGDGTFSFIPDANYNGPVPEITYTMTDGSSGDTSTLTINVTPVDDAFSDADETLSVAEDTTLNGTVLSGTSSVDGPVTVTGFNVAGDTTNYSAGQTAAIAGVGSLQINGDGTFSFIPVSNYNGPVPEITYTMTDGSSGDTSTLTINVTPVDDAFSDADEALTVAEDTTLTGNVLTGTSSVDGPVTVTGFNVAGDTTNYSAGQTAAIAGVGSLQINGDGTFSFIPVANYNGPVPEITYTMTDGSSGDTSTLTINVTPVDDAFSDANEVLSVAEDTTLNGNVLTGTSSVDGPVTVTGFSVAGDNTNYSAGQTAAIAGVGSLQINGDGTFSFIPVANYNGPVPEITYTMTDGSSGDTSTLTINVTPVDDAFSDANEVLSVAEDTTLNGNVLTGTSSVDGPVTVTGFNVAGDTTNYSAGQTAAIAGVGSLQINGDGTFSFIPDANYNGPVPEITYTMTDGSSGDTSTLTINVTPVDDAFSDADEALTVAEDTTLTGNVLTGTSSVDGPVTVTGFNVAGDTTNYSAGQTAAIAGVGSLQINGDGTFSFIPVANYNGPVPEITYTMTDGSSGDTSTLTINVTPVDDAFSDADEALTVAEDSTLTGTVLSGTSSVDGPVTVTGFNVAGDTTNYSAGQTAAIAGVGSLQINGDGTFSFIPVANYNGPVPEITYTMTDGSSGDTSTLTINVTPVDDAFSDADEVLSVAEDTTLTGTVLTGTSSVDGPVTVTGFNVAGDTTNYSAGQTAAIAGVGSLQINGDGTFSFIPEANYNGPVPEITYTMTDGSSGDTSTLTINVTPVDDAFSDADEVLSVAEDSTLTGTVLTGTSSVDGPVTVTGFNVAGDTTNYSAGQTAAIAGVGSLQINGDGTFSFIPVANYNGPVPEITYTMTDGSSGDTSTLTINVTPVDDAFSDADEALTVAEDTTLTGNVLTGTSSVDGPVTVTGFNVAGDTTNYSAGQTAAIAGVGSLQINGDGTFSFIPVANYNGPVPEITYTMTDGSSGDTSTLTINVTPVDDAFSDADEALTVAEDTTLTGNVLTGTSSVDGPVTITGFNVAGDTTNYSAGQTAAIAGVGSLQINGDGTFSFIPVANYNGPVPEITYTMTDGSSGDTSTLSINVTPVDDAFSDADEVLSVAEDSTLTGTVLSGTSSVDGPVTVTGFNVAGDTTNYSAGQTAAIAGVGSLQINGDGTFSFIPDANYNGLVPEITYTMTDGSSGDTSTLTINVTPVDDAFSDADEVLSVAEDTTLTGTVLTGTSSVDGPVTVTGFNVAGDTTNYSAGQTAAIAGVGSLQINGDGTFSFIPEANYNGPVPEITYTMTDGSSGDTSTLTINVTPVDDAFSDADEVLSVAEDSTLTGTVLTGTSSVDGPVTVTGFNVAGDTTNYSAGQTAAIAGVGSLQINGDGTFSFIPVANYNGPVPEITYTMTDGSSGDTSTLTINVTPVDDAFSDANEVLSVAEDTTLNGTVLSGTSSVDGPVTVTGFNVAGDTTNYSAGQTAVIAGVGSLQINGDGTFSFIPVANYNGPVPEITYTMTDGSSGDTSTLTINVTPVDDAFSDADEVLSVAEDTTLTGTVLTGTSSVDGPVTVTGFNVAGDTTNYSAGQTAAIAGVGSLQINGDGTFSFIPEANYNGPVPEITYTMTDGSSGDTSTLTINVTPVDDAFSDADEVLSVAEDSTLTGTVLSGTSSVDGPVTVTGFNVAGDTTNYSAGQTAAIAGVGSLQINGDGTFSFIPVADYNGPVPVVSYTMTDGSSGDTSTLTINVTPVDDAFSDANEVLSVAEDTTLNGNVLTGTSSVDGPVTVTGFSVAGDNTNYSAGQTAAIAGVGSLQINGDGTFSFIPVANYNGPVPEITYTMTDGSSGDTSTLTINVTPVDDAFSDADEALTVAEDTTLTGNVLTGTSSVDGPVTITGFNVAGDTTNYSAGQTAAIAGVGSLQINGDGTFSFIPVANYNGPVPEITYTMTDGSSGDTSTLSINVTPVDDAFSDADEVLSVAEDSTLTGTVLSGTSSVDGPVTVTGFNVAGDTTNYSAGQTAAIAGVGSLQINGDGTFSFIPDANYNGLVPEITYTMTDGSSGDTSTLTINVTPVDDAFSDADEVLSVAEDTTLTGTVLTGTSSVDGPVTVTGFNVAGDTTNYSAGQTAAIAGVGSLQINGDGTFSFIPEANYNGPVPEITYTMTDGSSGDTSTLTINVTPVDDAFSDADEVLSVAEDSTLTGTVLTGTSSVDGPVTVTGFNVAGDTTNYSAGQTAAIAGVGSLQINGDGTFSFIPVANYNGPVPEITYTMTDGSSGDTSTLTINVTPVDDAFSDANEVLSVAEDTTLNGNVLSGTSSVDGPVTVTGFNVAGDTTNYSAGQTAVIAGVGSLQINGDGTFSFIPVANYNGPVPEITYTMTDGSSGDTSTLTINVTPVDDAFSDADEVLSVAEDTTLTGTVLTGTSSVDGPVTVTGFNVAGDTTNYSAGQTAAIAGVGSLQINGDGTFSFIPEANYNGPVPEITYTMTDGSSGDTSTLTINVTPVDDAFSDADEVLSVAEDSTLTGTVLSGTSSVDGPVTVTGFNVAGDTTNYSAGQTAAIAGVGSLQINGDGTFSFIPVADYNGPVPVVSYTMTDGSSGDTSTLTINVTPVDDAFSDANEVLSVAEDTTLNGNVLTGTSSVDGPVTVTGFSVAGDNTNYSAGQTAAIAGVGSLQINGDGTFSFIPVANYNGPVPEITYTMTDGSSGDTSTLTINVTPVDDAFSDADEALTVAEDTTLTGNVLTGTSSVDGPVTITGFNVAGDTTNYSAGQTAAIAGVGSLQINGDGTFSFIPVANYNGPVPEITYTMTDGSSGDTSTLSINVTPVDDAFSDADEVLSVAEDSTLTGTVLSGTSSVDGPVTVTGFNVAGDTTNYSAGQTAAIAGVGSLQINGDGTFSFIPEANYNGPVPEITYTMTDGSSGDTSTLTINVTPVDDAFSDADEILSVAEDTTLTGTVLTGTSSVDGPVTVTAFNVAGDTTNYSAGQTAAIAGVGSLQINGDGTFSFIPEANYNGPVPEITYTMTDGSSGDTSTLTINVTPVDDAFSDADEVLSVAEDSTLTGTVLSGTSSVDGPVTVTGFNVAGDTTNYSAGQTAAIAGVGSLQINGDGTFSFIPVANYNGPVPEITYTMTDGSSGDTSTLTINVTPVDDAFSDANEVLSVAEDTTLNGNVLSGTSSVDGPVTVTGFNVAGDTTNYSAGQTAAIAGVGSLQINGDGTFSFIPVANYNGPVPEITYTMTDGSSGDTSTLTINVTPVDDAFSDANEVLSVAEDTTLNGNVLTGTSSVDGPVTVTGFSVAGDNTNYSAGQTAAIAGVGSLQINGDGTFSFIPDANYNGPVPEITYTMTDGSSGDTSTLTINVTPVDDAFSDADETLSVAEDTTLNGTVLSGTSSVDGPVTVTGFNVAGDTTNYSAGQTAAIAGVGSLQINGDGTFSFIPVSNYNGPVPEITYTMTDGSSGDTSTLTINVTPVDDAFSDADEALTVAEDTTLTGNVLTGTSSVDGPVTVTGFNVAGDTTNYSAGQTAAIAGVGSLQINGDGTFSFIPVANYNGPVPEITYTMTDGSSGDTSTLTINVTPVDDAFSDADEVLSVAEDSTLTGTVLSGTSSVDGPVTVTGFNVAGDTTNYSAGQTAAIAGVGSLQINGDGTFSFIPVADYNGPVPVVSYTMTDGSSGDNSTLTINVTPVADIVNDAVTLNEDTVANIDVNANDTFENTEHTITAVNGTAIEVGGSVAVANGTVLLNANGTLSFTPALNYNGTTNFTYTVTSGGVTETATVNLTVNPINDAPANSVPGAQTTNEDMAQVFSSANGNAISLIDIDSASVTTAVSVLHGTLTVSAVVAAAAGVTVSNNGTANVTLVGAPNNVNAVLNGLIYNPIADYNGADSLTVVTSDGTLSDTDSIAITVTPVADITNDAVTLNEDTVANIDVNANDTFENTGHTITAINGTAIAVGGSVAVVNGTVLLNANGTLSFTPAANYNGTTSFTYTVTSGGVTETATVNLTVNPVNDAPINSVPGAQTTTEDTAQVFSSANGNAINLTDIDSATVTTTVSVLYGNLTALATAGVTITNNGSGTVTLTGSPADITSALNGLTYTPVADYNGVDSLTVVTTDGTLSDTDSIVITVTPVADIANDAVTLDEDTVANIDVNANDTFENTGHTITAINGTAIAVGGSVAVANGSVILNPNGTLSFTPNADYNGSTSFTYTVTSGGVTETATVNLTVNPVNEAPVNSVAGAQTINEDATRVFSSANGNAISLIDIDSATVTTTVSVLHGSLTALATAGVTITNNGTGTVILTGSPTNITTALNGLTYTPVADYNGADSLTIVTNDGTLSDTDSIAITVTPVVDIANDSVTTNEDTVVTINVNANDTFENPGHTITAINGTAIAVGGSVAVANGTVLLNANGTLSFTPAANYNGTTSFTYTVTSGGVTETATANVTVNPVNDAPSGTNTTVTTLEDTAKVFTTDNFGFSDLNDSPANTLQAVRITTLPSTGSLTLNGIAVTTGQLISATDIAAGLLVFTPAIDLNGPVTFTFQVQDSGGTANGGVNLDPTPNIMTVDVTAVADTPVIYAHLSLPTVIAGTEIIAGNFSSNNNENNFSNWSKVALFSSTFAEIQGGNNKTSSEADLFNNIAWAGETGSNSTEVSNFNSRWSKTGGAIVYNTNDLADDAQGILLLNSNQLTSAERNLTNYVISLDMFADADSPRVNGIGIVFGYQNSSNYFLVRWENPSIEYSPGGIFYNLHPGQYHEFTLVQIVNNVPIDLARTTFNADDWFHVDINVSNLGISVSAVDTSDPSVVANFNYIFGSVSGAATAAPALNTIGLYSFDNDSEVRWDNINVNQPLRYEYTLQTEAYLKDVDGSETLGNITLAGIPSGVTLFDTVTNTSIPVNAGSATIIPGNDIRLVSTTALTAAQINAISASVSSVESSNGSTASQTTTVQLDLSGAYAPETFTGTNAAEWLEGGDSNDVLDARGGNDVIIGGLGNDTITTGAGADQVVLLKGQGGASAAAAPIDTITDFTVNVDTIVIKGTNIIGVAVSTPVSNTYTITVNYSGGAPTEYFKVTLSNGATLNDSGDNQLTGVVVSGGTATIDGTIVGAILYLDINGNNQEDAGERLGITDQYGHVEWVLDLTKLDVNGDGQYTLGEARAVQTGGFDIDTGLSYAINLFGPVGSSVISPLTSLLQAQLESGFDYKTANAHIVAHLGLPEGTELISLNPITGSNEILAQNASVMTAAVQFAEIAAIRYSTDEGHVSFSVFDAISKALLELPDGVVADFTDKAFLQNIASHLDLGDFVNQDVIDFMAASQRALQTSIETLAPGENALAAISEVQHLTQGSYAQTLESYMNGYLPSHLLSDISVIILAFSSSIITYEELKDFNNQFTDVVNQWMNSSTGIPLVDAEYKDTNQFVHEIDSVVNHFISAHNLYVANPVDYQQPAAEQHVNSLTELGSGEEGVIAHEVNTNEITNDLSSSMGGLELHGSTGNDFIYGGDGNDLIFGGEGDDHLYGGKGNDTIIGGSGNDIIQGGIGNDTMTGGGGNDIFVFEKADIGNEPAIDTITDFKLSKEGDASGDKSTLDLTDLFKDSTLSSNSLDSLLQISTVHNESTNQTDTVIKTDPTGGAHFNASPETIVLSGVDVVSVYGTSDSAELVQQMLAANVLVMGH